jgi:hypothetical protein
VHLHVAAKLRDQCVLVLQQELNTLQHEAQSKAQCLRHLQAQYQQTVAMAAAVSSTNEEQFAWKNKYEEQLEDLEAKNVVRSVRYPVFITYF